AFSEATAPDSPTGCAAPTLVAGAIAATFVDNRMNVPADAARAPEGETYPITGTFAFRIACVIWRIDESSPPGVSSVSSTAAAPASAASAMPPSTWSATKGSTTPSIRSSTTSGAPDCASAPWAPNDTHAAAREASTAARRRIITSPPPSSHRRERKARYPLGVRSVIALACVWAIAWSASPAAGGEGDDPFTGSVSGIDRDTRRLMVDSSWHAGCPTPLRDLRIVRVTYRGFDGAPHRGRLAVHRRWAD